MNGRDVMNHAGTTLIMRAALLLFLILAAAFFRTLVGPGRKRGGVMLIGTLGGTSLGVFLGSLVSPWLKVDTSAICASIGIVVGWTVSWIFARRIPQDAG
jgi:hypothetical protein